MLGATRGGKRYTPGFEASAVGRRAAFLGLNRLPPLFPSLLGELLDRPSHGAAGVVSIMALRLRGWMLDGDIPVKARHRCLGSGI